MDKASLASLGKSDDWYERYQNFAQSQWDPTRLSSKEEEQFRQWLMSSKWFREIKDDIASSGERIDDRALYSELTGPRSDYDYRGAWKAGVGAQEYQYDDRMHWPSSTGDGRILKSPKHPTAWMEFFMDEYGVDPNELGLRSAEEAKEYMRKNTALPMNTVHSDSNPSALESDLGMCIMPDAPSLSALNYMSPWK